MESLSSAPRHLTRLMFVQSYTHQKQNMDSYLVYNCCALEQVSKKKGRKAVFVCKDHDLRRRS